MTSSRRTQRVDIPLSAAARADSDVCVLSRTGESSKSLATVFSTGSDVTRGSSVTVCLQCGRHLDSYGASLTSSTDIGDFRSRVNSRAKSRGVSINDDVSALNSSTQRRDVIERLLNRTMDVTVRRSVAVEGAVTTVARQTSNVSHSPTFPICKTFTPPLSSPAIISVQEPHTCHANDACNPFFDQSERRSESPDPSLVVSNSTWYVTLEEMGAEHLRTSFDVEATNCEADVKDEEEASEQLLCLNLNERNVKPQETAQTLLSVESPSHDSTHDVSCDVSRDVPCDVSHDVFVTTESERPTAVDLHRIPLHRDTPSTNVTSGPRRGLVPHAAPSRARARRRAGRPRSFRFR